MTDKTEILFLIVSIMENFYSEGIALDSSNSSFGLVWFWNFFEFSFFVCLLGFWFLFLFNAISNSFMKVQEN